MIGNHPHSVLVALELCAMATIQTSEESSGVQTRDLLFLYQGTRTLIPILKVRYPIVGAVEVTADYVLGYRI